MKNPKSKTMIETGGKQRRLGVPDGKAKPRPMPRRVNVRLSDRDYLALNKAAIRQKVSLAQFLRDAGLWCIRQKQLGLA